ncbi:MAG: gamma carbonic anhydrase family protein [Gammaproteobacteria bacterium]|jgi:carbonic anhydrase/acetyltransferase-like protein (isoleucine patch superfamily)
MTLRAFRGIRPDTGQRCYVDDAAVVIGDVILADDVSVWPGAVIRGDVNRIRIGPRTNIQDGTVIHVTHDGPYSPGGFDTFLGEEITVGHKCLLHACHVGHRCLIGMGAIVMDGAVLEDEILLAAGSLVSPGKRLRGGRLYRGSPAREVRELTTDEKAMLAYSANHYVRLKDDYLDGATSSASP